MKNEDEEAWIEIAWASFLLVGKRFGLSEQKLAFYWDALPEVGKREVYKSTAPRIKEVIRACVMHIPIPVKIK